MWRKGILTYYGLSVKVVLFLVPSGGGKYTNNKLRILDNFSPGEDCKLSRAKRNLVQPISGVQMISSDLASPCPSHRKNITIYLNI